MMLHQMNHLHLKIRMYHLILKFLMYLMYQLESGVCCPVTMTFAGVPALAATPAVGDAWVSRLSTSPLAS